MSNVSYNEADDSITKFSYELAKSISEMNHNIVLIKTFMSAQNTQNECFMNRDLEVNQRIYDLEKRLSRLEKDSK